MTDQNFNLPSAGPGTGGVRRVALRPLPLRTVYTVVAIVTGVVIARFLMSEGGPATVLFATAV